MDLRKLKVCKEKKQRIEIKKKVVQLEILFSFSNLLPTSHSPLSVFRSHCPLPALRSPISLERIRFRVNYIVKSGFVFSNTARSFLIDFKEDIFGRGK